MPSIHSRPLIESDGNNFALRRIIRLLKRLISKVSDAVMEGSLVTEEVLDAIGAAVVQLMILIAYPFKYFLSMPEIFRVFTGKPLPMTLPLIFVLHIILLIYSSYVLCYMPAVGLRFDSVESISFHLITALAIVAYYRGVVTDPGKIPETPEWEDKQSVEKKAAGLRFCSREKKWKPDRTHYCSAIGRNVLKMDHYCPWLANCVGFLNHKYFLLFIMYATVASGWATIASAHLLATSSSAATIASVGLFVNAPIAPASLSAAQIFFLTEGLCISSLISLILTPFTAFHLFLVARNQTTLEYCEGTNATKSYDMGILQNFAQVFGYNPLLWLLPIETVAHAGLDFPKKDIIPKHQDEEEEEEEDLEEARVRREFETRGELSSGQPRQGTCCMRRWDDSPLLPSGGEEGSNWFYQQCVALNDFRETLVANFSKIINR